MAIEITTNNVPRDVIEAYELTAAEREEFDYYDWTKMEAGEDSASFVRYKGELYDLGEFERWDSAVLLPRGSAWDGFTAWTYFAGLVVRYCDDFERVVVGRYFVGSDY